MYYIQKHIYIFSTSFAITDIFMGQRSLKLSNVNKMNHFIKGNLEESLIFLLQTLDMLKYTDKNESISNFVQHSRSWTKKLEFFLWVFFFQD